MWHNPNTLALERTLETEGKERDAETFNLESEPTCPSAPPKLAKVSQKEASGVLPIAVFLRIV